MGLCDCGCGHHPAKYSNPDLINLGIGGKQESTYGCGPSLDGTQKGSCYDWCNQKGFSWPNNEEYSWGGKGKSCKMCSFEYGCNCSGKTGCCDISGSKCSVTRVAYNGDPGSCCLLGGAGQTTDSRYASTFDWSKLKGTTYTCNVNINSPYQQNGVIDCAPLIADMCSTQDQDTWDQWNPSKNGKCIAWVNGAGSTNYTQAATVLQKSLQSFANKYKTVNQSDKNAQEYLSNVLSACAKYPGACDTQLSGLCSTLTRDDVINSYGDLKSTNNQNIVSACGCHLPQSQYTDYGQFGIDEKYYDSCDPLCKLNPAIPKATCSKDGQCTAWPCDQTVCIIDDVTVDIMNSNVPGGVNFNVTCGGCGSAGGCLCIFSDINVFSEASKIGGIDFNLNCGGNCAVADPDKPGAYTPVNCSTGNPTNGGGGSQKWWDWIDEHKKDLLIAAGVIIGALLLTLALVIFGWEKSKKSTIPEQQPVS